MGDWVVIALLAVRARGLAVKWFGEPRVKRIEDEPGWFS